MDLNYNNLLIILLMGLNTNKLFYYQLQAPAKVYYIPEFLDKDTEDRLWKEIYSSPKPKWTALSNRRLQNWGGLPHEKGMIAEPLPLVIESIANSVRPG